MKVRVLVVSAALPGPWDAVSEFVRREGEEQGRAGARSAQHGGLMNGKQFCSFLSASENKIMLQGLSKVGSAALLSPRLVLLSWSPCWAQSTALAPNPPFACAGGLALTHSGSHHPVPAALSPCHQAQRGWGLSSWAEIALG